MSANPLIKICNLWMKTSAKGNQYFVGRMGSAKVLILESAERGEGAPTHTLLIAPAPDDRQRQQQQADRPAAEGSADNGRSGWRR